MERGVVIACEPELRPRIVVEVVRAPVGVAAVAQVGTVGDRLSRRVEKISRGAGKLFPPFTYWLEVVVLGVGEERVLVVDPSLRAVPIPRAADLFVVCRR